MQNRPPVYPNPRSRFTHACRKLSAESASSHRTPEKADPPRGEPESFHSKRTKRGENGTDPTPRPAEVVRDAGQELSRHWSSRTQNSLPGGSDRRLPRPQADLTRSSAISAPSPGPRAGYGREVLVFPGWILGRLLVRSSPGFDMWLVA